MQLTHLLTHRPAPFTCWCDIGVVREGDVHVGWCAARPEGSEGEGVYGVRKPVRKESSGRGVRDDLLIVAWQPFSVMFVAKLQDSL